MALERNIRKVRTSPLLTAVVGAGMILGAAGCGREDMHNQPRVEPYEASDFFADGKGSRPLVPGTVAQGSLEHVRLLSAATGGAGGQGDDTYPIPITRADLKRGQERYNIYCAPCHSATGDGDGMIVRRGFTPPPSLHIDRLRQAPAGHYVNVMTNGFGAMYSYSDRINIEDRWRIAAYIRALQLSQNADPSMMVAQTTQPVAREGDTPTTPVQTDTPAPGAASPQPHGEGTARPDPTSERE